MHIHTHTQYTHIYTQYTHTYTIHTHTYLHTLIHTHIHIYTYIRTIYTLIYTYIHTYTYTCTHIHAYTHTEGSKMADEVTRSIEDALNKIMNTRRERNHEERPKVEHLRNSKCIEKFIKMKVMLEEETRQKSQSEKEFNAIKTIRNAQESQHKGEARDT